MKRISNFDLNDFNDKRLKQDIKLMSLKKKRPPESGDKSKRRLIDNGKINYLENPYSIDIISYPNLKIKCN